MNGIRIINTHRKVLTMRTLLRTAGILTGLLIVSAAVCWLSNRSIASTKGAPQSGAANQPQMIGGQIAEAPAPEGPVKSSPHLLVPKTPVGFAAWQALQTKIDFPFAVETSLEKALSHIKEQLAKSSAHGAPINLYVDPVGLTEADKSLGSPVILDLKGVPAGTGLAILLAQLGLAYYVQDDGIVLIEPTGSDEFPSDPHAEVLKEIRELRSQIRELRSMVLGARSQVLAPPPPRPLGPSGGGGVMTGPGPSAGRQ